MNLTPFALLIAAFLLTFDCSGNGQDIPEDTRIKPVVVTQPVPYDSDDPAIWIHPLNPSQSLIIGTDKGSDDGLGGLYVFDLEGRLDSARSVPGLQRPNNVDVAYGLQLGTRNVDIAVATVRGDNQIKVFSLPDMVSIDGGGIEVFVGEEKRSPMGIALYTDPVTGAIDAIVSRKSGPTDGTYLWQYRLEEGADGNVTGRLVRTFGAFTGKKEIEAVAVDNERGFVYYSEEGVGVRKYHAHSDSTSSELNFFAQRDVREDHEGLSLFKREDGTGYLLLSDQQARRFNVYTREGDNTLICSVDVSVRESDGSEMTSRALGETFAQGLFVAMSDDRTFHYYKAEDILKCAM